MNVTIHLKPRPLRITWFWLDELANPPWYPRLYTTATGIMLIWGYACLEFKRLEDNGSSPP